MHCQTEDISIVCYAKVPHIIVAQVTINNKLYSYLFTSKYYLCELPKYLWTGEKEPDEAEMNDKVTTACMQSICDTIKA